MTKIDIFPHILPKPYFDKMLSMSDRSAYMQKRVRDIPVMYDPIHVFASWSSTTDMPKS
jgi:hypothetical protein